MRKVFLCLLGFTGIVGALATFDYVTVGNTTSLVAAVPSPKGDVLIDRTLKGDRQMVVAVKTQSVRPAASLAAKGQTAGNSAAAAPAPVSARLPDGCEQAVSPLAAKTGAIRARCIS